MWGGLDFSRGKAGWYFVSDIVFANLTHVGLTFGLLLNNAEMKTWARERFGSWRRFILHLSVIFIAFFAALSVIFYLGGKYRPGIVFQVYVLLHVLFATHHAFSQSGGIYGAALIEKTGSTAAFNVFARAAKTFTLVGTIWILALNLLDLFELASEARRVLIGASVLPLFFVFLNLLKRRSALPIDMRRQEVLFLSRFAIWLFYPFSFLAPISAAAIHGIDYLKVSSHMAAYRLTVLLVGPFLLFIVLGLMSTRSGVPSLFYQSGLEAPWWLQAIGIFTLCGTYLHYYLDRQIFKMNEASSRKNIAPLLRNLTQLG
jgi:hypothetical protein